MRRPRACFSGVHLLQGAAAVVVEVSEPPAGICQGVCSLSSASESFPKSGFVGSSGLYSYSVDSPQSRPNLSTYHSYPVAPGIPARFSHPPALPEISARPPYLSSLRPYQHDPCRRRPPLLHPSPAPSCATLCLAPPLTRSRPSDSQPSSAPTSFPPLSLTPRLNQPTPPPRPPPAHSISIEFHRPLPAFRLMFGLMPLTFTILAALGPAPPMLTRPCRTGCPGSYPTTRP
jgi:hypothetical protein